MAELVSADVNNMLEIPHRKQYPKQGTIARWIMDVFCQS